MRIFLDQHHFGLYNSFHLLFEKRIGAEMYRPIGRDWLDKGYWRIAEIYNNHPTTIQQYLGVHDDYVSDDGIYNIWEPGHEFFQHAITYEKFMRTEFDIVIATVPEHIESFKRLCAEHPSKPKMIYQIGNAWPVEAGTAPNIMASAKISGVPANINFIEYHQEFDTSIFCQDDSIEPAKNVFSFINCLNTASIYAHDWPLFEQCEKLMPNWVWSTFGGSCRDGEANGQREVAKRMKQARFIWHVKAGGDGYGHVLHSAMAVGRPLIVKRDYYIGKLAEPLLIDGETCIAIDNLGPQEIVNKIEYYSDDSRYIVICNKSYTAFKTFVDFDKEELALRDFMQKLI